MPSLATTIVAPTGGWNKRDPLELMPETDALDLENFFPETTFVRLRKGFTNELTTTSSSPIYTSAEYIGDTGSRRLLISQGGGLQYGSGGSLSTLSAAGTYTSDKWQYVNFQNRLILVNGVDQPKQFDGSAVSDATYTTISDDATLANVAVFKKRLYFVEVSSQSYWYGGINNITGALTEEDVGGQLKLGGTLVYVGAVSADTGGGLNDLLVVISEAGEVLMYSGLYPGDSTWQLAARYYIAPPLGRRAFCNYENDLAVLTREGLVSMSRLIQQGNSAVKLTDKIQDALSEAVNLYGSNFGWQVHWSPATRMLIVNVPISEGATSEQYVMNTLTGAWCKFTGINTCGAFTNFNNQLYFGGATGNVYRAENGYSDNGADIPYKIRSAFSYFGDRSKIKHFKQLKPQLLSDAAFNYRLSVDVDFGDVAPTATASSGGASGSTWDDASWDTASWDVGSSSMPKWWGLGKVGRCAAWRMEGEANSYAISLAAVGVLYESGGMF